MSEVRNPWEPKRGMTLHPVRNKDNHTGRNLIVLVFFSLHGTDWITYKHREREKPVKK